jgi:hypothetical protein
MQIKVYRVAAHDASFASVQALHPRPGERSVTIPAICAYESAELAALCTAEALADRPVLLRETLLLPSDPHLHEVLTEQDAGLHLDDAPTRRGFAQHLAHHDLLSLWLPAAYAPQQHLILLNPAHAAFASIHADFRYVMYAGGRSANGGVRHFAAGADSLLIDG